MSDGGQRAIWVVFVAGHKQPVKVPLDYDVLGALWAKDAAAWSAVLEFVEWHLESRVDEEY